MLTLASASVRATSPSVPGRSLDVDHQRLALVGDPHPGLLEGAAYSARVGVVDEDVDEPLALAGQRAHPEQVDAGVTGRLPEPGELAGAVREDHREVSGHRAHSNLNPNEQPPRGRDQPVPAPARGQPGRLASVGPGGAGAGDRARPPRPVVDRLLVLSLVPRDGARVVRGPRDRTLHERALRPGQGRPGGAPGRRLDLHGGRAGDDRTRRLAADRVLRPGGRPLLRRHLLPARAPPRDAELPDGDGGGGRVLGRPARADPRVGGAHPHPTRRRRPDRALDRAALRRDRRRRGRAAALGGRHAQRRLRRGAQVPARVGARAPAHPRPDRRGGGDARRDGRGRDQ